MLTCFSFLSSQSKRKHLLLKIVINFSGSIFAALAVKNGVLVYISMNGATADNKSFRPKTLLFFLLQPRSCGKETCSMPQRTATRLRLEPGTSRPYVIGFTVASVRPTFTPSRF